MKYGLAWTMRSCNLSSELQLQFNGIHSLLHVEPVLYFVLSPSTSLRAMFSCLFRFRKYMKRYVAAYQTRILSSHPRGATFSFLKRKVPKKDPSTHLRALISQSALSPTPPPSFSPAPLPFSDFRATYLSADHPHPPHPNIL